MACELEQQSVDLAAANLDQALQIQAQIDGEKQQADWAVMAANAQLAAAVMLLWNCLNGGGGGFGMMPQVLTEVQSVSRLKMTSKDKVTEIMERLKKSNAVK